MTYRVDRVNRLHVPVGMNSIIYIGKSERLARKIFNNAETGIDSWGQKDIGYGLILSVWSGSYADDDKILLSKGGIK